ncbi:hypothetical protein QJQ45_025859 [Haematococcus lacustris]|nr:hypothetical protein QJQ45_025859 [Haematococcus lacustris]
MLFSMAKKKRRTVPRPVPEDPDSDIEDRDEALQPDLTEAQRNKKASGEARAARDRDNTYHARKAKLAHLIDHLPQALWDAFLADAVQPRVEAISERGVLASLLFGLLVRGLFTIRVADPLGLHDQPVYTDIPVSQAAIPDLSCRNLFRQLTWPAAVAPVAASVAAGIPDLTHVCHCVLYHVWMQVKKQAQKRWPDRILALAYGAASFSGSGSIGCRGVPVSQMRKEAVKQFGAGRVVLVDEFRTSRVSSAYSHPSEALPGQPPESFRWLRPVYSEAKRSRVRGLMSSPSYNIRFYDRDVSAALNIRRCAVGPGPRPTELCYWDGRPAMPKPGRPGQEWVYLRDKALLQSDIRSEIKRCVKESFATEAVQHSVQPPLAAPWPSQDEVEHELNCHLGEEERAALEEWLYQEVVEQQMQEWALEMEAYQGSCLAGAEAAPDMDSEGAEFVLCPSCRQCRMRAGAAV